MITSSTKFEEIKLREINLETLNQDITKRLIERNHQDDPKKEDIIYKPNAARLGVVTSNNGMLAVVDEEMVTRLCPGGKYEMDIYKKSRTGLTFNFLGPTFTLTLDVEDLLKHHGKGETTTKELMADRYQYNSRIRGNQETFKRFLIEE
jgi:hypothetical protein